MSALWTAAALRAATGGALAGEAGANGVSIDSRSVAPGDLFVALRDQRDGHAFVPDALARGAALAMVDRDVPGTDPARLLRVADTQRGLADLGAAGRARAGARIAAVTGSVGKTGTKEMLRLMLARFGAVHAAQKSFNNHWGVPLTLALLPPDAAHAVIEIGMNNPGEIAPLARLARPDVAAITAIGTAHVGHLGSVEAIADEKSDILAGLEPDGIAVLPVDGAQAQRLRDHAARLGAARVIGFGRGEDAEVRLLEAASDAEGTRGVVQIAGRSMAFRMPAVGLHHAGNGCCALAVVAALGLDPAEAAAGLADYAPGAGRGAPVPIAVAGGTALLIDDSYNGAPDAMRAGLQALALRPAKRRVAVLGDMRELGAFSAELHEALAEPAAACDLVFACGPEMRRMWERLPAAKRGLHAPDSAALAPVVAGALRHGDVVLVKGALGSDMAVVVRALTARGAAS